MPGVKGRSGGRNRKTTAELRESGGIRAHRHDARADALDLAGYPKPPENLTDEQKRVWQAVLDALPAAALGSADSVAMAEMCEWFARYRRCWDEADKDPANLPKWISAAQKAWGEFRKLAIDYGLTPQARAGMKLPEEKKESPLASILERKA